ncbi:MAG: prealbumin-like fold domain-containing protein, partial [Arcanobacterium sp.]|nr:prealbumin-like fold domain-containing protein [Arcanobacterium sp.]
GASGGASSGKLLEGSEWKLTLSHAAIAQPTGATPVEFRLADCAVATSTGSASAGSSNACTGAAALDKDPTPGVMKITNLPLGTYTLQEMKAPSGYILDPSQHSITLDSEEPYTLTGAKAILNEQRTGPALPLSGGVGRDFFLLAGGGTLIAALTVSLIMLGRRRTQKLG